MKVFLKNSINVIYILKPEITQSLQQTQKETFINFNILHDESPKETRNQKKKKNHMKT